MCRVQLRRSFFLLLLLLLLMRRLNLAYGPLFFRYSLACDGLVQLIIISPDDFLRRIGLADRKGGCCLRDGRWLMRLLVVAS